MLLGAGANLGRGGGAAAPSPLLPHSLPLEPITLGVQKYTRSGELRRVLGVPLGSRAAAPPEDHSYAKPPPPPPVATEELKHFKESVLDTSKRAKDRVKLFGDSLLKLEKYKESVSPKKRQRSKVSANGASMGKLNRNALGAVTPQRMEERARGVGMPKRLRSFMGDVQTDSRSAGGSRQQMVLEKGGGVVQDAGEETILFEEKIRPLPAGGEGWDMENKKRRSVGAVVSRITNTDRDIKRTTMHPKMGSDSKLQSCDAQHFRFKPLTGVGVNKMDASSGLANADSGVLLKNEIESGPLPRERAALMEQKAMTKGINKSSIHEDSLTSSANRTMKAKVSRAPRTGSVMLLDSSLKVYSSAAAPPQGSAQSTSLNRVPDPAVAHSHRDHIPPSPSSHAMTQWVGQRPHKNSRTRRASIGASASNHAEAQILSKGFPASDFSARTSSTGTNGSMITSSIENNTPKSKGELQSPFGFSESEESGAGDSKLNCKGTDTGEIALNPVEEARSFLLPTRETKLPTNEIGDGMRKQGRRGRSSSLTRSCSHPVKKLDNAPAAKSLLSFKPSSDTNKSKTGRPLPKKLKDRKVVTRVGQMRNGDSVDPAGESNDDRGELFAAANSAWSSASVACTGSFWKKMESIFSSLSAEDLSYLKQELNFAQELDESLSQMLAPAYNVLGGLVHKEAPASAGVQQRDGPDATLTKTGSLGKVAPLYQRVLSALIDEDGSEELYAHSEGKNIHLHYASDDSHCGSCNLIDIEPKDRDIAESEAESMVNLPSQRSCLLDRLSCGSSGIGNPSFSDPLHRIEQWPRENTSRTDAGLAGEICSAGPGPGPLRMGELNSPSISVSDHNYQQMSLDDKLLLELQSVGLFPDSLPDLAEEESINEDIAELKQGLYHQIERKKRKLGKIDKAVQSERDVEKRTMEQVAINQLIERAYRKRLACRGNSNSRSTARKVSRQAVLAFVKRTLARCRKFEETGSSCFSEPALQEIIFSRPPCNNGSKSMECVGSGTGSNTYNEVSNLYTGGLGAVSSTCERDDSHSNNFDRRRKRDVLLDDVVGSASSKIRPTLDGASLGGVKRKRSYSNGNPTKEKRKNVSVSGASPSPQDGLRNERKTKLKPNQRTASKLGNGTRGPSDSAAKGRNQGGTESWTVPPRKSSHDASKDVANLQLNEFDPMGLGVPNDLADTQDLDSWLNIDEDGLQDLDTVGLEIPMDDLADLMLM